VRHIDRFRRIKKATNGAEMADMPREQLTPPGVNRHDTVVEVKHAQQMQYQTNGEVSCRRQR
jgi:hypothetical protein